MSSPSRTAVTPVGYVLLCEIGRLPRGGHALRLLFESSPLSVFSSSPGSIYPALKRLQEQNLVAAIGTGRGGRYELTSSGREVLLCWLAQPVTPVDVSERLEMCLLRFAFLEGQSAKRVHGFLTSLVDAATLHAATLEAFLQSEQGRALPFHGRLAVEHGVRSIEATINWATDAQAALHSKKIGGNSEASP